jgi:hypothetical protein
LCRQPGEIVNVCGLFRRKPATDAAANWQEDLRGAAGSLLRQQMGAATFVADSFCAVAGINLKPQQARRQSECRIGDALTMIPPITGNGMSMAFESAEMAIAPVAAWSCGDILWTQTQQTLARQCDAAFGRRLAWSRWLQAMMFAPGLQSVLIGFASSNEWFWQTLFARTR